MSTNNSKYKRVAHISDIHIRLLKRHKEYKGVFENLFKSIKKEKIDLAVITGDLVHNKISLSPEAVSLMNWFFTELSNVVPSIIIKGNHDCILNQPHRMDSITPLLQNFKPVKYPIDYIKKSGVYDYDNLRFGVYALDDEDNWPTKPQKEKDKTYIALYHGSVDGSFTDSGFGLSSRITPEIFAEYDYTFLGDIHKMQFLEYDKQKNPTMGYSGSLIGQNFGESTEKGYLIWDFENNTCDFVKLHNDFGFYKIYIDGKTKLEDLDFSDAPKYPYIKVYVDDKKFSSVKSKQITSFLHSKLNPLQLSIETQHDKTDIDLKTKDFELQNVSNIEVQKDLIEKFLSKLKINEDDIADVIKLHNGLYQGLTISDDEVSDSWNIQSVEFDNTFSYGSGNVVDFDKLQGLIGIFSPNGIGKSALLCTLLAGLFNSSSRTTRSNIADVINRQKDNATIRVNFSIGKKQYQVERIITRNKRFKNRAKNTIHLYVWENGEKKDITGKSNTNSIENQIRSWIGNYNDHKFITFGLQNELTSFIDLNQAKRKELFYKFFGLDILEELHSICKEQNKSLKSILSQYDLYESENKIKEYTEQQNKIKDTIQSLDLEKDEVQSEIKIITDNINKLVSEIKQVDTDLDYDTLKTKEDRLLKEIAILKSELEKHTNNLSEYEDKISQLQKVDLRDVSVEYQDKKEQKAKSFDDIQKKEFQLSHLKSQTKVLDKHDWFSTTPVCKKCDFLKNAFDAKNKIPDIIDGIKFENEHLLKIESVLDVLKDKHDSFVSTTREVEILKDNIKNTKHTIEYRTDSLKNSQEILDYTRNQLSKIDPTIDVNDYNEKINEKILKEKTLQEHYKNRLSQLIDWGLEARENLGKVNQQLEYHVDEKERILDLQKKVYVNDLLLRCLNKDGISLQLIKKILPRLNTEINRLLANILDFTIDFSVDKNHNFEITINNGKSSYPISLCSGMEKTLTSMAIRATIASISTIPKCNLFVIDEGLSTLDIEYRSSVIPFLEQLKTMFQTVVIISHTTELSDVCDNIIDIYRDGDGFSKLQVF